MCKSVFKELILIPHVVFNIVRHKSHNNRTRGCKRVMNSDHQTTIEPASYKVSVNPTERIAMSRHQNQQPECQTLVADPDCSSTDYKCPSTQKMSYGSLIAQLITASFQRRSPCCISLPSAPAEKNICEPPRSATDQTGTAQ